MQRKNHWAMRLAEYLYAVETRGRFLYGSFDCCMFVAGAILVQTGVDVAAEYRQKYWTKREADIVVGGDSDHIFDFAASVFKSKGMQAIEPRQAGRGDVALVRLSNGADVLGIVDMNGTHVRVALEQGLGRFPLRKALAAWTF